MLVDFCLMSALLVVSHLLRRRLRFLQRLYIPTPIVAGLLGLALGHQFAGILPFTVGRDDAPAMTAYPGVLVALVFATLFLGRVPSQSSPRGAIRQAGDTFFYNLASELGQYALALVCGAWLLSVLFPALNPGFALMMPAGFAGGHGTATAIGGVLVDNGWPEALTVGYTFATVGLLAGIVGGMALVKLGVKQGWTRVALSGSQLPESVRGGFVPADQRQSIGEETVHPISLDPLAWHVALVFTSLGIGYLADVLIRTLTNEDFRLPLFALAMLAGALVQRVLDVLGLGEYVDRRLMERIGSSASDYLVGFAVASIEVTVVVEHAVPLALVSALGVGYALALFWFLGRKMFHNFWFERSLFVYCWNTGVVGIGIALLRVVDPRLRSGTLQDFGVAYVAISFVAIALIVAVPQLVVRGYVATPGVVLAIAFVGCILMSRSLVGWWTTPADKLRAGEGERPG